MEMTTTVTAKGQVTIPQPVRDLLASSPAARLIFSASPTAASFWFVPTTNGPEAALSA